MLCTVSTHNMVICSTVIGMQALIVVMSGRKDHRKALQIKVTIEQRGPWPVRAAGEHVLNLLFK
jgi:hypothetical protein